MHDGKTDEDKASVGRGWNIINLGAAAHPPEFLAAVVYALSILILGGLIIFGLLSSGRFAYETLVGELKDRVEVAKVFFPVIVALIGGPILIWRALTAHWGAQAARRQADTGREALFTSLFTTAVEQLGATRESKKVIIPSNVTGSATPASVTETEPNLEVRLGAIYALERIAQDSERDHWPIMEVLCSYVRNPQNCGSPTCRPDNVFPPDNMTHSAKYDAWIQSIPEPRVDIQAVMTVIARRAPERVRHELVRAHTLDFRGANIQRSRFSGGSFGSAIFFNAHLECSLLMGADLRDAIFADAYLERANLGNALLDRCNFSGAVMPGARLNSVTGEFSLFHNSKLEGALFFSASLSDANFIAARLNGTHFNGAVLRDVKFNGAFGRGASFLGAELHDADFLEAKFFATAFIDTKFHGGSFARAQIEGSAFFGTDLSKVSGLSSEQLSSALGDESTVLPEGLTRPSEWPNRRLDGNERTACLSAAFYKTQYKI